MSMSSSHDLIEEKANSNNNNKMAGAIMRVLAIPLVLMGAYSSPMDAMAISGGGKDFAEAKITGQVCNDATAGLLSECNTMDEVSSLHQQ